MLDKKTVSDLGGKAGQPDVGSDMAKKLTGPSCNWPTANDGRFDVTVHTVHREEAAPHLKGIGGILAAKDDPRYVKLEIVEIPGHPGNPAVISQEQLDVDEGRCAVYVGVANDLVFVAGRGTARTRTLRVRVQ